MGSWNDQHEDGLLRDACPSQHPHRAPALQSGGNAPPYLLIVVSIIYFVLLETDRGCVSVSVDKCGLQVREE